tara:strand:+ start:718 stop:879 length:162 start_codon:yes stop_codon:yes gene_type:complete
MTTDLHLYNSGKIEAISHWLASSIIRISKKLGWNGILVADKEVTAQHGSKLVI